MLQNSEINIQIKFVKLIFKQLTGNTLSDFYIKKNYINFFVKIKNKKTLMIAGSQGSGKSTLAKLIMKYFKKFYNKNVVILSIDDFYLSSNQRKKLAKKYNTSLFKTRGVPGTHNLQQLIKSIDKLKSKKYPTYLPIFDKVTDNRKKHLKKVSKADLIILEGWCVGSKPIDLKYLKKNLNNLEKNNDHDLTWRTAYNNWLIEYQSLFKRFNFYIYIKFPDWKYVIDWKYKQELSLRNKSYDLHLKNNLNIFVQYYEKLSKWMSLSAPEYCDVLIKIGKNQLIKNIKYK